VADPSAAATDDQIDFQQARLGHFSAGLEVLYYQFQRDSVDRAEFYRTLANVAVAADRYRRARGTWPTSLAQLVPDHLNAVPLDPISGEALGFQNIAGGIAVYHRYPADDPMQRSAPFDHFEDSPLWWQSIWAIDGEPELAILLGDAYARYLHRFEQNSDDQE